MGPEQSLMSNEELHEQEPRSSTEIESDIRETRSRMDATLDELGDRLTARSVLNSALDWWESEERRRSQWWCGKGYLPDRRPACERKSHPRPTGRSRLGLDDH